MEKAIRVNADYEAELFHGKKAPQVINQSLEFFSFFLDSRPLFTEKRYDINYLNYVEELTGRVIEFTKEAPYENWWGPLKDPTIERSFNSKLTSTSLNLQEGWCQDTHIIKELSDLDKLQSERSYVIKDPFGMSGQKFRIIKTEDEKRALAKLVQAGPLIAEPFFERLFDFSHYIFPDKKRIAYQNLVDKKFQYKGSLFPDYTMADLPHLSFYSLISHSEWEIFRSQLERINQYYAKFSNEVGYSIDSFVYSEKGELRIRSLSEVNYRRTMGRMAYELALKFSGERKWARLLLGKCLGSFFEIKRRLQNVLLEESRSSGVIILSPGDTRFDMLFLCARDEKEGKELLSKVMLLLPDGQFSVDV